MCGRASPGNGRTHLQVRASRDERDFPRGLNTRMHHVPRPTGVLYLRPSYSLHPASGSLKVLYCTYAEQISLDELPVNTLAPLVQFDSIPPLSPSLSLSLLFRRTFFQSVSISDSARSSYSPESDRSSVDFARGGFSQLASTVSVFVSLIYFFLTSPAADEGSRSSGIQFPAPFKSSLIPFPPPCELKDTHCQLPRSTS